MAHIDKTIQLMDKLNEWYDGDQSKIAGYLQGLVFLYVDDKMIDDHIIHINYEIEKVAEHD